VVRSYCCVGAVVLIKQENFLRFEPENNNNSIISGTGAITKFLNQPALSGANMLTGIYQSIALFALMCSFYLMDFILIKRFDRQRQAKGSGRSWDFTLLMFGAGALLILQPLFLPQLGWSTTATWGLIIQIIGLLLIIASFSLHAWARIHLRHFYAERVEVQQNHRVIDTGPYALMCHPVITSFFGIVIGMFLIVPAVTTLALMIYVFWDFSRAARQEEELLSKELPDYIAYMNRTPRFLPRLWKK
jgi:protein-S-isoprenylcysteine O-methyltransferase Ste14